jgi:type IV secretion system protein VirB1
MNALNMLFLVCAPLVHQDTLISLVATESGFNPYAIAVVNSTPLQNQPTTKEEAISILNKLDAQNINYSIGLGQINKANFEKYGVTGEDLLDPCLNLSVSQDILKNCYEKSPNKSVSEALSCYYSGNYNYGFVAEKSGNSYLERIINNIDKTPIIPNIKDEIKGGTKKGLKKITINKKIQIKSISNNIKTIH